MASGHHLELQYRAEPRRSKLGQIGCQPAVAELLEVQAGRWKAVYLGPSE